MILLEGETFLGNPWYISHCTEHIKYKRLYTKEWKKKSGAREWYGNNFMKNFPLFPLPPEPLLGSLILLWKNWYVALLVFMQNNIFELRIFIFVLSLNIYWTEALQIILFQYFNINPFPIIKTHFSSYLLHNTLSTVTFINSILLPPFIFFIPTNRTLNFNYIKGIKSVHPYWAVAENASNCSILCLPFLTWSQVSQ